MARKRRTYSAVYITAAREFVQHVHKLERNFDEPNSRTRDGHTVNREHEIYTLNAIINSVLYAEAHINEFYREIDEHLNAVVEGHRESLPLPKQLYYNIHKSNDDFYDRSWYQKYNYIVERTPHAERFDDNKEPYHNAFILNKLRNHLAHFKSEWVDASPDPEPSELGEMLKAKNFELNPWQPEGAVFFPDRCLGYGCARWALESAIELTDEFHNRVGSLGQYSDLHPTR